MNFMNNNSSVKFKSFLMQFGFLIATIITLFFNGLATFSNLGGASTKQISDKFFTILTPAGFTFSIWSVIYLGLLIIGIGIALKKIQITSKALAYYTGSAIANCAWIIVWQYLYPAPAAILLFILVYLNARTYLELKKSNSGYLRMGVTSLYLVYLGWSIVASLINATVLFKYVLNVGNLGINEGIWGVVLIVSAFIINTFISDKEQNPTTIIVFWWALLGIKTSQSNTTLIYWIEILRFPIIMTIVFTASKYHEAKTKLPTKKAS